MFIDCFSVPSAQQMQMFHCLHFQFMFLLLLNEICELSVSPVMAGTHTHTQCNLLNTNATDGKRANSWWKKAVDKMVQMNIAPAAGTGFNFPLWVFLLQLGKLVICILIAGGNVNGEREREREGTCICWLMWLERKHQNWSWITIYSCDTAVAPLNDSSVTE